MVFNLTGEDTLLLRWKVTDLIYMKQMVRRIAVRIRNRQYRDLDVICDEMQRMVNEVERSPCDLFDFLEAHNIGYVLPHMGRVWGNYNILALDFRWN